MELDIFIPSISLAFEYQGEYHFKNVFQFEPLVNIQNVSFLLNSFSQIY